MDIRSIKINKNRGWRGLAEVKCYNNMGEDVTTMIFSFSADVWNDMLRGYMVIPYDEQLLILEFNNTEALPKGQRSVLIKNFRAVVHRITAYGRTGWNVIETPEHHRRILYDHIRNRNNHTQSDWNCIGIRVTPMI